VKAQTWQLQTREHSPGRAIANAELNGVPENDQLKCARCSATSRKIGWQRWTVGIESRSGGSAVRRISLATGALAPA
jgi:hypothetical protein